MYSAGPERRVVLNRYFQRHHGELGSISTVLRVDIGYTWVLYWESYRHLTTLVSVPQGQTVNIVLRYFRHYASI